ncbi:right-handed parallel beta-helix repeat-containing protein [Sunxiuqinia dokdonensis]|uniref:Right handed beta helix domain-containing protein n=1 Tax=Sunxiuqinia dokdonensis TaxID=1409788 RepID=A0A0L8VG66_9BACT|nr:hypothetical protein [Sunxiuqinia dokdonensis]KOH47137.1 hypothetical protein NC99_00370 [Sunxiuqinia dokdonensis]
MKKFTLIVSLIAFTLTVGAQKVALHSSSGIQHFTGTGAFVDACNAAIAGDTIYLPGGGFSTPGAIDKKLLIYGAGHYPDSTTVTGKTIISGSISLYENADGFHMEGIDLTGSLSTPANASVNQIVIKYCRIQGEIYIRGDQSNPTLNLMVTNCVVQGTLRLENTQNAGIFNSIFNGEINGSYGNLFQNNIFLLSNYSSTVYRYTLIGDNNTIENNIFLRTSDREISGNSNIIRNNITPKTDPFWGNTPTLENNYTNVPVASIFMDQTGNVFDYTHNYHLQAPASYLGVDGTQVGIYGGHYPYKEGAVPSNPHFVSATIAPQTDADGKLNVIIQVTAQDK